MVSIILEHQRGRSLPHHQKEGMAQKTEGFERDGGAPGIGREPSLPKAIGEGRDTDSPKRDRPGGDISSDRMAPGDEAPATPPRAAFSGLQSAPFITNEFFLNLPAYSLCVTDPSVVHRVTHCVPPMFLMLDAPN